MPIVTFAALRGLANRQSVNPTNYVSAEFIGDGRTSDFPV
jgi:hypothetical protein